MNILNNTHLLPFITLIVLFLFCAICAVCADKSDRSIVEKFIDHLGSAESKKVGLRVLKKLLYYYLIICVVLGVISLITYLIYLALH